MSTRRSPGAGGRGRRTSVLLALAIPSAPYPRLSLTWQAYLSLSFGSSKPLPGPPRSSPELLGPSVPRVFQVYAGNSFGHRHNPTLTGSGLWTGVPRRGETMKGGPPKGGRHKALKQGGRQHVEVGSWGEAGPAKERSQVWCGGQLRGGAAPLWAAERSCVKPSTGPRRVPTGPCPPRSLVLQLQHRRQWPAHGWGR